MLPTITDGELNVLRELWRSSPQPASALAHTLRERIGWNRNTTYTFIGRLVDKGVIARRDPGFICDVLYSRDQVRVSEGRAFLQRMYEGSLKMMLASFVSGEALSQEEIDELHALIENARDGKGGDGRA